MNKKIKNPCTSAITVLIALVMTFSIADNSFAQLDGTALLVQDSPKGAGVVTPTPGVHRFGLNSRIRLTATPKQGYEFVYWIGQVTDTQTNNTFVQLDSPKIVIAVFERISYPVGIPSANTNAPLGGIFASAADYSRGGISPIGRRPSEIDFPSRREEEQEPEEEPEFPVPNVPEPSTTALFLVGSIYLLAANRRKNLTARRLKR